MSEPVFDLSESNRSKETEIYSFFFVSQWWAKEFSEKPKLNLKGDQIGREKHLWITVKSFHVRRHFNDFNARSVQTTKAVNMMVFFISLNATLKDTLIAEKKRHNLYSL